MSDNILVTIDRLPAQAKHLLDEAIRLANDELHLQIVDTSVVLLAIIRLGDANPTAKWLHSVGLTEQTITRQINIDYTTGHQRGYIRDAWNGKRPIQTVLTFTSAVNRMINRLDRVPFDDQMLDAMHTAKVLDAVAHSDSRTVEHIFASVGLAMSDVRKKLETPSILDLEKIFTRRR